MLTTVALAGAFALADGPSNEPPIVEQLETYYDVSGASERQLLLAAQRLSPHKPYPAYTEWNVSWVYQMTFGADGKCRVSMARSKLRATVTMPRWSDSSWASDELRLAWILDLQQMRQHEQDHVQHGIAAAEEVQKALLALPATEDCEALKNNVERAARAMLDDALQKDRSFDFRTVHGNAPTTSTYATERLDDVNPPPFGASLELVEVVPRSGTAVSKDTVVEAELRSSISGFQENQFVVVVQFATTTGSPMEPVTSNGLATQQFVVKEASGTLRASFAFWSVWRITDIRRPFRLWFYLLRKNGAHRFQVVTKTAPIDYEVQ